MEKKSKCEDTVGADFNDGKEVTGKDTPRHPTAVN